MILSFREVFSPCFSDRGLPAVLYFNINDLA